MCALPREKYGDAGFQCVRVLFWNVKARFARKESTKLWLQGCHSHQTLKNIASYKSYIIKITYEI